MTINITVPTNEQELKPKITVIGVGGAGCNAVNNMIRSNLEGVDFIVTNTDSQSLQGSLADCKIQLGQTVTQGLGAGSRPEIGKAAAEEAIEDIMANLDESNMVFITAGMGGGTGTGAGPIIAQAARERGILTVGVVTKPFHFEGAHRMRTADDGIEELHQYVDTLIIIPNQNLFRVANEKTTFADAFNMADDVLHAGVRGVTDLMVMPGLINLDFADIRTVMSEMGKAMMGTGEATGEKRALDAAESAINNPLLEDISMKGARGVLINITGGFDMTLYEVDEAANRIRDEVDPDANIIFGSSFDEKLEGAMRVSVVSTGIAAEQMSAERPPRPALSLVAGKEQAKAGEDAPKPAATVTVSAGVMANAAAAAQPKMQPSLNQSASTGMGMSMSGGMGQAATARKLDEEFDLDEGQIDLEQAAAVEAESDASPVEAARDYFELKNEYRAEEEAAPAPAEPAEKNFIPAPPVMPTETAVEKPAAKPDPFRQADMMNAGEKPVAEKPKSIFQTVMGLGSSKPKPAETPKEPTLEAPKAETVEMPPVPEKVAEAAPAPAAATPAPQMPEVPVQTTLDAPAKPAAQKAEDDLLDIPAFLRRQAN